LSTDIAFSLISSLQKAIKSVIGNQSAKNQAASQLAAYLMPSSLQFVEWALTNLVPGYFSQAHGLGRYPTDFFAVLHCVTADTDTGLLPGQEIDATEFRDDVHQRSTITAAYDSINVYGTYASGGGFPYWNGVKTSAIDYGNFTLRIYYR